MNCRTFQLRLQSVLDERRLPQEDSELLQHAWKCERCQRLMAAQQQLLNLLCCEPPPAPPADMASRIIAQVNPPLHSRTTRGVVVWTWLAVAAAMLIIASPIALRFIRQQHVDPNSFVNQRVSPDINNHMNDQQPSVDSYALDRQNLGKVFDVWNRFRDQQFDQSVNEITSPLRPITASFGVTLNALRKTLPLPSKNAAEKPQADARNFEVFA